MAQGGARIVTDPVTGAERPERYRGEAEDLKAKQAVGSAAEAVGGAIDYATEGYGQGPGHPQPYSPEERTGVPRQESPPADGGYAITPFSEPPAPLPVPSRATMIGIQGLQTPPSLDLEAKDIERRMQESYADQAAAVGAMGENPSKGAPTPSPAPVPTDVKEPKAGTGAPLKEEGDPYYGGDQSFKEREGRGIYSVRVKDPNGRERIIRTNRPRGHIQSGGEFAPFNEGMEGDAAVASGAAGSAFMGGDIPSADDLAAVNFASDSDRSAGWAARAALREAHAQGSGLSMDPRDIMDRRRFEEQETARDMARESAEMEAAKQELGLVAAERAAMVDPYVIAEIEAQGKYGGAMLQEQSLAGRQEMALGYFKQVSDRIAAAEQELQGLDPQSAQAAALKQAIDRMIQERRELANIALGFRINDPRQSELMAMLGFLGGGLGTPGAGGGTEGE